jgi:hypothetical protein
MTRLFAALGPATLLAAILLTACSSPPPPFAPTAFAIPHAGESASQFQANDLACRNYMVEANRSAAGNGSSNAGVIPGGAQSPYDAAYAQCMTSKGYVVGNSNWLYAVIAPPRYGAASTGGGYSRAAVSPGGYSSRGAY